MTLFRGRRLRNRLESVKVPSSVTFVRDPDLEQRRQSARRTLIVEGRNVDRPKLILENPDFPDLPIG